MKSITQRIITMGTFPYSRALLLQIQLQTEGIDCFLVSKDSLQPIHAVDLRVMEKDVAKAMTVIDQSLKEFGAGKEKAVKGIRVIRRILVPVDFSSFSSHAARFAITLGQKFKAEVKLFHVFYNPAIDITPYDDHYSYQVKLSNSLREIEKNARISLIKMEQKLKTWCLNEKIRDVKITTGLANGESSDEIISYSQRYRPALIIMGTRGLTKGSHPLGRVTTNIIERSPVPVLALPEGSVHKINDLNNVLFATDFDPSDYAAINRLLHILSPFEVNLHCLHISVGMKKPWDPVKMEELKEHLTQEYSDNRITFSMQVSPDFINGMEAYIRNNAIDAIAVVTHRKGMLQKIFAPSMTKKIFTEIGKPLFVFHASS